MIQKEELFNLGEESCCCFVWSISFTCLVYTLAQSLSMAFFSGVVKEVFNSLQWAWKKKKLSILGMSSTTVYKALKTVCVSLCFAENIPSALREGLHSYFSACCRAGVNAYVFLISFSWKSNFPISFWNILPYRREPLNCNSISSGTVLNISFSTHRSFVSFFSLLCTT